MHEGTTFLKGLAGRAKRSAFQAGFGECKCQVKEERDADAGMVAVDPSGGNCLENPVLSAAADAKDEECEALDHRNPHHAPFRKATLNG